MKIKDLKSILTKALNDVNMFEDDIEIKLEPNTYFVKDARYVLSVSGYDGGYLDLRNITKSMENEDDERCPKCGEYWHLCDCDDD